MFAVARDHILKLMKADTYVRWLIKRRDDTKYNSLSMSVASDIGKDPGGHIGLHFEERAVEV